MQAIEPIITHQNNRALLVKRMSTSSLSTLSQTGSFYINDEDIANDNENRYQRGFIGMKPSLLSNRAICNSAPKRPTRRSSLSQATEDLLLDQLLTTLTNVDDIIHGNDVLLNGESQHQRQKHLDHDSQIRISGNSSNDYNSNNNSSSSSDKNNHIKKVKAKEKIPYDNSRLDKDQHLVHEKVNKPPKIPRRRADIVWDFSSSCIDMNDNPVISGDDDNTIVRYRSNETLKHQASWKNYSTKKKLSLSAKRQLSNYNSTISCSLHTPRSRIKNNNNKIDNGDNKKTNNNRNKKVATSRKERQGVVRSVSFDDVQLRIYERILIDDPSSPSFGPKSVGIGWKYRNEKQISVEDWELHRSRSQSGEELFGLRRRRNGRRRNQRK